MAKVGEIANCSQCGKTFSKQKLMQVEELWNTSYFCKECYQKHQRSMWGFW